MISIIAVGKRHEEWIETGIERYQKRLKAPFDVEWHLLPHSSLSGDCARQEESERINKRISDDQFVVLLDEQGRGLDSIELSRVLEDKLAHSAKITFIIGGAYGVDESIHRRAEKIVSLSKLVFPHQLVRLILIEQLYRAQDIARGGKYHHE